MRVLYSGLLRSPASWARVGRELLSVLRSLGVEAAALRMRGFLYAPDFALPEGIREVRRDEFPADVEVTFAHPALYARLRAGRRVGILVYEADQMPAAWAEPIRRELDLLLVPSEFCRRGALAAGVPSHLVRILPFGVDARVFAPPEAKPASPFTFLAVAAPHIRKGLRELLRAYRGAFTANDGVMLLVKTTYDPADRRQRFRWELEGMATELRDAGLEQTGAPKVELMVGSMADRALAQLYRRAQVFVGPSYGEGFGLAALEAAASGCAIVTTGWGAATEVFDRDAAAHIPFDIVAAAPYEYDRESGGYMARPRVADLARTLRLLWEDRGLLDRLRRQAASVAVRFTWQEAGRMLREYLTDVCARPPRS